MLQGFGKPTSVDGGGKGSNSSPNDSYGSSDVASSRTPSSAASVPGYAEVIGTALAIQDYVTKTWALRATAILGVLPGSCERDSPETGRRLIAGTLRADVKGCGLDARQTQQCHVLCAPERHFSQSDAWSMSQRQLRRTAVFPLLCTGGSSGHSDLYAPQRRALAARLRRLRPGDCVAHRSALGFPSVILGLPGQHSRTAVQRLNVAAHMDMLKN